MLWEKGRDERREGRESEVVERRMDAGGAGDSSLSLSSSLFLTGSTRVGGREEGLAALLSSCISRSVRYGTTRGKYRGRYLVPPQAGSHTSHGDNI